jgi:hypothetical protein
MMDQMWGQQLQRRYATPLEQASQQAVSPRGIGLEYTGSPAAMKISDVQAPIKVPENVATPTPQPTNFKGYADFLKKNYEPLAGGFYLGSAYGANQDTNQQTKDLKERMALTEAIETKRARDFARSVYAPKYADGGPVEVGLPATGGIPEFHVRVPAWMQEDTQREGGLAALQPGIRQGMAAGGDVDDRISQHQSIIDSKTAQAVQQQEAAEGRSLSGSEKRDIYDGVRTRVLNKAELGLGYIAPSAGLGSHISGLRRKAAGGYINLQPMGEQEHPQALIPRAQPYAAASPQRREVIEGFERGGLIDGEGDGMSDSIPAHIEGQEPVKVADGEYLIPKDIAAKYGPEKLKHMMTKVRAAAHAKKGKQIIQDAAKRALISSLSGVRA